MRVQIDVTGDDATRTVSVSRIAEDDGATPIPVGSHQLTITSITEGAAEPRDVPHRDDSTMDPGQLAAVLTRIDTRSLDADDVVLVGRHLFDVLIGPEWADVIAAAALNERIILGLRWPSTDKVLSGLPWESMHDGTTFLAVRPGNLVATARIVAGSNAQARSVVDEVPRVLFVIGSSLDDADIRPGAELMGLLRDFEREPADATTSRGWVESRLITSATLSDLSGVVRSFKPHCVHIVAHGDRFPKTGEAALVLNGVVHDASELASALLWSESPDGGERPPGVVVLSACDVGNDGESVAGSTFSVPLAARLVGQGVPVVVGMAGEVSDAACRLFTRRFGNSLLEGDNIAVGAAHGRKAAYTESETGPPTSSIDWALPTVFVSDAVPPSYVPVTKAAAVARLRSLAKLLNVSVDRSQPVFCGRDDFFVHLDDLVEGRSRALVAWARSLTGMGEKRLLREIGRRALHRGVLPIDVEDNPIGPLPATVTGFVVDIARSVFGVASNLELPKFRSELVTVLDRDFAMTDPSWALLKNQTAELRNRPSMDPGVLRELLAADIESLLAAAREKYPTVLPPSRSAVVLLHRVHRLNDVIDDLLGDHAHGLIGPNGLGTATNPVPVVISTETTPRVDDAKNDRPAGWNWEEIRPLTTRKKNGDRDELIFPFYLWVLMNPRPGMFARANGTFLGNNVYAPLRTETEWRDVFAGQFSGLVDDLSEVNLYDLVEALSMMNKFSRGDDERVFEAYSKSLT